MKFTQLDHPILKHKLAMLRDKNTNSIGFRGMIKELATILAYEACRDMKTVSMDVETPLAKTKCQRPESYPIVMSIMRAGNGMLEGVLQTLPYSSSGHIGIYRDKFINNTVEYYFKLPDSSKGKDVLLLDPMVATGDTAIAAIDRLKQYQVGKIKFLCILISPMALERLAHFHPDVEIIAVEKEEGLTDEGYLLPGIGDAGNRLYNGMELE